MKRTRCYIIVCLIEILILIRAMLAILSQESLVYRFIEYTPSEGESKIYTESISVPKGIYTVTVEYDGQKGTCFVEASQPRIPTLRADGIQLSSYRTERSCNIYVNDDLEDLRFRVEFWEDPEFKLERISLETAFNSKTHQIFVSACILVFINLLAAVICFGRRNFFWNYEITGVLVIGVVASLGMFAPYYVWGHDIYFHMARIDGLMEAVLSGQFPVKIQPNWFNDFGSPVSAMYGDTLLFFPALLRMAGVSVQNAYKIYAVFVNIGTAAIAYFAFCRISKDKNTGLLGSCLYTLFPYRLTNVYIRAALGEYTAMMFFPLIVLGFWYAFEKEEDEKLSVNKLIAPVIGFSGIIQTHVLSCLMAAMLVFLVCVFNIKKVFQRNRFFYLLKVAVVTVLVNLWYIVPFLRFMQEDVALAANEVHMTDTFQKWGADLEELFALYWNGTADVSWGTITALTNKFPKPIGIGLLLIFVLALYLLFKGELRELKKKMLFCMPMFVLMVCMATNKFPYVLIGKYVPLVGDILARVQFPWRYLGLAGILGSIIAVLVIMTVQNVYGRKAAMVIMCIIGFSTVMQGLQFTYSVLYRGNDRNIYDLRSIETNDNLLGAGNEYLYTNASIKISETLYQPESYETTISAYSKEKLDITVTCTDTGKNAYLILPVWAYPGYEARDMNTKETFEAVRSEQDSRLMVNLPEGYQGTIKVGVKEPLAWRLAELISLLIDVLLTAGLLLCYREKIYNAVFNVYSNIKILMEDIIKEINRCVDTIWRFTKKIFANRMFRGMLVLLGISVLIEVFVFNFRHWETIHNAPYVPKDISLGLGYMDNHDGTYDVVEGNLDLEITNIDDVLSNAYIDIELLNLSENEVRSTGLWQSASDYSHKKYYNLPGKEIWQQEERSKYMTYHLYGECKKLLITPTTLRQGDVVAIRIIFNPVIPMFFSWERILYCFLILASIYLFRPGSKLHKIKYMELTAVCKRNLIILICLVFMAVSWKMTTLLPLFQDDPWDNYKGYQHLAEALAEGSFSLLEEPSQTLLDLDNPYDAEWRSDEMNRNGDGFLWDHAYYNGKYYIYFGVVPALMFHLPYYLLTGRHLMNHVVIFIVGCFYLAGVLLLLHEMIRHWYRNCSVGVWFMSLTLFMVGVQSFYLIKRPDIYAVPIFMASAFGIWGITFILKAQGEEKRLCPRYLMAGSLCIALIAGCRPQQFLFFGVACILLGKYVFPLSYWKSREGLKVFGALAVPMMIVAAALMYYNYARFGSPFDFGANYNLTLNDMRYRGWVWDRIPLGLMSYLFWPIKIKPDYPFIESIYLNSHYMGVTIQEPAYGGLFAIAPFFIMCAGALLYHKELRKYNKTTWFIAIYSMFAAVIIIMADTQMAGIVMRYYTDFAPFLGLAALIVTWGILEKAGSNTYIIKTVITFMLVCYLYEFVFHGLKFTVDVASSLQDQKPAIYAHFKYLTAFWL